MNKKTKYAINGALTLGLLTGLSNARKQNITRGDLPFDWQEFTRQFLKGSSFGLLGGYAIGALEDYLNEQEKPINTDAELISFIELNRLNKNSFKYKLLRKKSDWLIRIIKSVFRRELISEPFYYGSSEIGTALKDHSDLDICMSCKPNSFPSTEGMYLSVHDIFKRYSGSNSIVEVRRQGSSIGVIFKILGKEERIDILPKKITQKNRTSGYIYVKPDGLFEKASYKKTDVNLISKIRLTDTQKRLLLSLKLWKAMNEIPIKSHLLQYLILEAYRSNYGFVPTGFTAKVIMVMKFIVKYFDSLVIRGIENSNNILTEIPSADKSEIVKACRRIIEEYEYQPNSIISNLIGMPE